MTLGFLRRNLAFAPRQTQTLLHTKHWFAFNLSMRLLFRTPMLNLRFSRLRGPEDAARWTFRRRRNKSRDTLDEFEWPSLEARREQSSSTFFYKIHSDIVFLSKNRYLTPVTGSTQTRASKLNSTQYHKNQAFSDALKNSFFPRTIPQW